MEVLGPIIGAIVMLCIAAAFATFDKDGVATDFSFAAIPIMFLFALPFGYFLGGLQALFVGVRYRVGYGLEGNEQHFHSACGICLRVGAFYVLF